MAFDAPKPPRTAAGGVPILRPVFAARPLQELAAQTGLVIDEAQEAHLMGFLRLLLTWNLRINLTGARSEKDLLEEHLPDSFAAAALIATESSVVDVGAGGGLPGLPTAILRPESRFTLVEPRGKRAAFLRTAAREFAPNVKVVEDRLEKLPAELKGGYDVAMSRATFEPRVWLEFGRQLVRPGGTVLVFAKDESLASSGLPAPVGVRQAGPHVVAAFR